MSKHRRNRHWTQDPLPDQHFEREEKVKALTAKMKEVAKAKKLADTKKKTYQKEAFDPQEITLLRSGSLEDVPLSIGMSGAVRAFRQTLLDQQSTVILNWPNGLPGVSALHSLALLCELAEGPEDFQGFTTVFYPASARTGANQRALLVNRDWLMSANRPWLNAHYSNLSATLHSLERTQARFHNMLARTKDLGPEALSNFPRAKAIVDRTGDRGHPTLFELIARRRIDAHGKVSSPEETFLDRSKRLSELLTSKKNAADYQRVEAVDPDTTPWLLSTIHGASPQRSWAACTLPSNRKPNVLLIDLQYRARARLGENWRKEISSAVSKLRNGDLEIPLILVTDDPFTATFLKWELSPKPKGRAKKRPLPVRFLHQDSPEILSPETTYDRVGKREGSDLNITVDVFASDVARFAAKAMEIRRDVSGLSGGSIARSIGGCLSRLRAVANSPLSQSGVSDVLFDPDEPHLSDRRLKTFDIGAAIAELRDHASYAGVFESAVLSLSSEATELAKSLSSEATRTTGRLYRTKLQALTKRATRTLVATAGVSSTQLLERWIETDENLSEIADRLGKKFDIAPARDAIAKLKLAAASPKPYGHVLLLSTQPRDTLAILAHPKCPKRIEIVCDTSSAKFLADYGKSLLQYWSESVPGRIQVDKALQKLNSSLESRVAELPEFSFGEPSLSGSPLIDLTVQSSGRRSATLEIHTVNGDVLHASPQTVFVTRVQADLEKFESVRADKITQGREILVPSPAFLEAIEASHEFRAAAAPLLADYHRAIGQRVEANGQGVLSLASEILTRMDCEPAPRQQSVRRWLDVASQNEVPIELRTPQAPRTYSHFLAFCKAIGIDFTMAEIYWSLAIVATRGGRIRSGLLLRKFYAAALIDPDALTRRNGAAGPLIDKIHDLSAEHVSEVSSIERVRQEDA
ncbi:hypothetical protein [Ruegeria sp. Ofav3-42]|uniref:hypothetical protein n=1 Tax=Ruegeria sp. Ofav3-42 TaxID=2917759 RepID=UPI001EF73491|nr:hypothetical protein [Ruegeria sp. Ofav3-42]MCG7519487.1 hypothetical protein [Ruegeria sp. Ofav3-42]